MTVRYGLQSFWGSYSQVFFKRLLQKILQSTCTRVPILTKFKKHTIFAKHFFSLLTWKNISWIESKAEIKSRKLDNCPYWLCAVHLRFYNLPGIFFVNVLLLEQQILFRTCFMVQLTAFLLNGVVWKTRKESHFLLKVFF